MIYSIKKHERYFFDIPVFRCDLNRWSTEQDIKKYKLAESLASSNEGVTSDEAFSYSEKWLAPEFSSYRYSEMVGMIRLYAMQTQIRAELFFVDKRITKALKNKKWRYMGKIFEFIVFENYTNEDIFKKIINNLQEENQKGLLERRFIDLEAYCNAGESIDFRKLAGV